MCVCVDLCFQETSIRLALVARLTNHIIVEAKSPLVGTMTCSTRLVIKPYFKYLRKRDG